jgi:type II secretory pathway component PulK
MKPTPAQHLARTRPTGGRRSFATVLALWAVAIASIVLVTLQSSAWRQAAAGRESIGRLRASWAARAGIEATIASLAYDTQNPDADDAFRTLDDLEAVGTGEVMGATYSIAHSSYPNEYVGAEDASSKINVNAMTRNDLLTFLDLTEDVADSILDWVDTDEDVRDLGAESGYYLKNKAFRYTPRNGPMRSLQELELVAGVDPRLVRGEDWNLNGRLDPNEDDGDASWPPDNADGKLDAGWSEHLTAVSTDGGMGVSGKPRLDLRTADVNEIQTRLELDKPQADAVAAYAATLTAKLADFIITDLPNLARNANASPSARQARALNNDQLALMFNEATLVDSTVAPSKVGKLNINTCSKETLEHLAGIEATIADLILLERDARPQGFTSVIDLLEIPAISRSRLGQLVNLITVRSNVFVVHSRGRDTASGQEVEISAVLDRSSLPVVIKDLVVH